MNSDLAYSIEIAVSCARIINFSPSKSHDLPEDGTFDPICQVNGFCLAQLKKLLDGSHVQLNLPSHTKARLKGYHQISQEFWQI